MKQTRTILFCSKLFCFLSGFYESFLISNVTQHICLVFVITHVKVVRNLESNHNNKWNSVESEYVEYKRKHFSDIQTTFHFITFNSTNRKYQLSNCLVTRKHYSNGIFVNFATLHTKRCD